VAVDAAGNVYIADTYNDRIRRVDATTHVITTLAGTGVSGSGGTRPDGDGGPATSARLYFPFGVAVDGANPADVFVSDTFSNRIRRIDGHTGTITAFAGTGQAGFADGAGAAAQFDRPWGIAVDPNGTVYVADQLNHRVRVIAGGLVSTVDTFAGTATRGLGVDPQALPGARLDGPRGVTALDGAGTIYVADSFNNRIRRIAGVSLAVPNQDFQVRTGTTSAPPSVLTITNNRSGVRPREGRRGRDGRQPERPE